MGDSINRKDLEDELEKAQRRIAELESAQFEQTRVETQTRRRIAEMTLLNRVTTLIASAHGLEEALNKVCAELASFLQVPQAGCAILDANQESARVIADAHPPGASPALGVTIPVQGNPSMDYILEYKAPLVVVDAQTDPLLAPIHDVMRQRKVKSILLMPILVEGKVIGTLGFDAFERHEFQQTDVTLVQTIVGQVGQLLLRRQTEQALEESNTELRFRHNQQVILGQLTIAFNAATSVEQVIQAIANSLQDLGYTYCSFWEKHGDCLQWITPTLALPGWLIKGIWQTAGMLGLSSGTPIYAPLDGDCCYARCYQEMQLQSVRNALDLLQDLHVGGISYGDLPQSIQRIAVRLVERLDISEHTVLPIAHYGVVFLASPGRTYSANHQDWIQIVLNQASTAIERLRAVEALQALNVNLEAQVASRTAEIAAEKEKTDAILRSVGDAITVTDLRMRIQYVNQAFTDLTGYTMDEVLNQSVKLYGPTRDS